MSGKTTEEKSKKAGQKKELTSKEKYDEAWNKLFLFFLALSVVGIYFLARDVGRFRASLMSLNPNYKMPMISDFKIYPFLILAIALVKIVCEKSLINISVRILKEAYRNPKNERDEELRKKFIPKVAIHIFKGTFYLITTIVGYFLLRQLDYFPKSLLGHGWMPNMFINGYPKSFFHVKPKYFDLYYLFCLSYFSCDMIWLLFINDRQTDFINMLLHHISTVSLIIFSYLTNYSNIGCIVLFLHLETDIFVHLTRLLLYTDAHEYLKNASGLILTINFLYIRLYVFGDVLYTIYNYITWKWGSITWFLFIFLIFLYCMHINWALMLLQKFYTILIGKKLSDTRTFYVKEDKENSSKIEKVKAN